MSVLKKNEYLLGLEKIYKKYGITKVYSERVGSDAPIDCGFFVPVELTTEALEELDSYSMDIAQEAYGSYMDCYKEDLPEVKLFYEFGRFFGEVSNANG